MSIYAYVSIIMHDMSTTYMYCLVGIYKLTQQIQNSHNLRTIITFIIGASLSEPHTYESAVCPPTLPVVVIYIYIYIYICTYLGQQFCKRFRRLTRTYVSFKDRNAFQDVGYVQRKTWMPFSRRAMRIFVHVDVSFV